MDPLKFHEIDEDLTSDEVAQLKFLCMDLVPKKRMETVRDAKDLFIRLEEQTMLDDGLLVPELLLTIRRIDLLAILNTSKEEVERDLLQRDPFSKGVSAYRKMLFRLSEDLTEENLHTVKFLLELPKTKCGASTSFLDIMIEMEKQQKLGEENLDELQNILLKCDKQLAYKIEEFKNMHRDLDQVGGRHPLQEVTNHEFSRVSVPNILDSTQYEETEIGRRGSSVSDGLVTDSDTLPKEEEDLYYSMKQRPLGYCLIINNYNFKEKSSLRNRTGTDRDKEELTRVFRKMNFLVELRDDLLASDIRDVIKEFAQKNHSAMDAFVCCVLSHGERGTVLGIDGKEVAIRDLTLPFAACHTLVSKPKLFFIQACQGREAQESVWMEDGQVDVTEEETYEGDARAVALQSIPIEADFLIGMATVEYYQSFRHITEGSIYIQELCRQMEKFCPRNEDILSILTKVNREVSSKILKGYKQMPEPRYTLTKKLVLPMD
ncbi:caspase-8-like isoform X3 [Myxocyprinus asiaticus]|uniref:caspase-8-like isoform X3 n=1 Tax=Myxocyprinus asiaticus TaxID=70543 RepID=UPI0022217415|nr:caspase-8-like isoform X3 [Myxocyprinus asiaticus]